MPETTSSAVQPMSAAIARPSAASVSELAIPVDFASDTQQAVIARVLFNAPIKREYVVRLKAFLDAWEKTLPQA